MGDSGRNTRERIVDATLMLFNRDGLINVRLQHIADEAGISVGNLAYHFPDKKQLIRKLERLIADEVSGQLDQWHISPHLIDFDNRLIQLFHLFNRYAFYFLDILEIKRWYPEMHERRVQQIGQMIDQIERWLEGNVKNDVLEIGNPSLVNALAESIWFMTAFWPAKNHILDRAAEDHEMAFRESVWRLITPHFTDKGFMEFEVMIQPRLFYGPST